MADPQVPIHYVSTHDEAERLIAAAGAFWIADCGCREHAPAPCRRSGNAVCLQFTEGPSSGSRLRPADRAAALALVAEARRGPLVARPFRSPADPAKTDGICFCCDDCCGYFRDPAEACDKGALVAATARDFCIDCGLCVEACFFKARRMEAGKLAVDEGKCYGCGLCVPTCPPACIAMRPR